MVVVAEGAINMRSTAVHYQVQYSNRFDTTTAVVAVFQRGSRNFVLG